MKQGEVYWIVLNPTVGSEIRGKGILGERPCLVVSPDILNKRLNTVTMIPLTSQIKKHPCRVELTSTDKISHAAIDQIRAIDKSSNRVGRLMCRITEEELKSVLQMIGKVFNH